MSAVRSAPSAAAHATEANLRQLHHAHINRPSTEPQHERHATAFASAHPPVLNASAISLGAQASSAGSTSRMPSYWLSPAPSGPGRARIGLVGILQTSSEKRSGVGLGLLAKVGRRICLWEAPQRFGMARNATLEVENPPCWAGVGQIQATGSEFPDLSQFLEVV